jgi:hypothetical protein
LRQRDGALSPSLLRSGSVRSVRARKILAGLVVAHRKRCTAEQQERARANIAATLAALIEDGDHEQRRVLALALLLRSDTFDARDAAFRELAYVYAASLSAVARFGDACHATSAVWSDSAVVTALRAALAARTAAAGAAVRAKAEERALAQRPFATDAAVDARAAQAMAAQDASDATFGTGRAASDKSIVRGVFVWWCLIVPSREKEKKNHSPSHRPVCAGRVCDCCGCSRGGATVARPPRRQQYRSGAPGAHSARERGRQSRRRRSSSAGVCQRAVLLTLAAPLSLGVLSQHRTTYCRRSGRRPSPLHNWLLSGSNKSNSGATAC